MRYMTGPMLPSPLLIPLLSHHLLAAPGGYGHTCAHAALSRTCFSTDTCMAHSHPLQVPSSSAHLPGKPFLATLLHAFLYQHHALHSLDSLTLSFPPPGLSLTHPTFLFSMENLSSSRGKFFLHHAILYPPGDKNMPST